MSKFEKLNVDIRKEQGTSAARRTRLQNKVPAVVYHSGEEGIALSIDKVSLNIVGYMKDNTNDVDEKVDKSNEVLDTQSGFFTEQLKYFERQERKERKLSKTLLQDIKNFPKKAHPMDVARTAVSLMGLEDIETKDNSA